MLAFQLPLVFGVAIAVAFLLYWVGGRISMKSPPNPGKTAPYACGEDLPVEESKIDLEKFLIFAVYFLIFDVLAFVISTSFYGAGLAPVAYSLIISMAVVMLILSRRHI
jgi:NADH:ubiquinone oxidoreductase subunit 3 (subunit A)